MDEIEITDEIKKELLEELKEITEVVEEPKEPEPEVLGINITEGVKTGDKFGG